MHANQARRGGDGRSGTGVDLWPAAAQATFDIAVPPGDSAQGGVFVGGAATLPPGAGTPGVAGQVVFVEPIESQRVVEQAPYSAEIITETTQMLADGNRISHRASARVARDSRGRERREHEGTFFIGGLAAQNRQALVTIMDPVSDTAVTSMPSGRWPRVSCCAHARPRRSQRPVPRLR